MRLWRGERGSDADIGRQRGKCCERGVLWCFVDALSAGFRVVWVARRAFFWARLVPSFIMHAASTCGWRNSWSSMKTLKGMAPKIMCAPSFESSLPQPASINAVVAARAFEHSMILLYLHSKLFASDGEAKGRESSWWSAVQERARNHTTATPLLPDTVTALQRGSISAGCVRVALSRSMLGSDGQPTRLACAICCISIVSSNEMLPKLGFLSWKAILLGWVAAHIPSLTPPLPIGRSP